MLHKQRALTLVLQVPAPLLVLWSSSRHHRRRLLLVDILIYLIIFILAVPISAYKFIRTLCCAIHFTIYSYKGSLSTSIGKLLPLLLALIVTYRVLVVGQAITYP